MPENTQLSEKEKKLVKRCINREEAAEKEFDRLFRPKIFDIARKFTNETEAEDLTQEILFKLSEEMRRHEIKQNLKGWVVKLAKNYCIDVCRKQRTKKALKVSHPIADKDKGTFLIEVSKDSKAIPPGFKEYHRQDEELYINIDTLYKRNIPPQKTRKDLEYSLNHIEIFYKLIEKIKSEPVKYERIFKINKILHDTEEKINLVMGRTSRKKIEKYRQLKPKFYSPLGLTDSEKEEYEKLEKQESLIYLHETLSQFITNMSLTVHRMVQKDLFSTIINTPFPTKLYLLVLFDLAMKFKTMKIKPQRLMFSIWRKVKDLRKGKYTDHNKIKLIFYYFKRRTKGTEKEFLFNSIDENLSTYDSIRKSYYKKPANLEHFNKLVDFIYKSSFRPEQLLDLLPGKWIKKP